MPSKQEPKWEVVDSLPGEKKPKARPSATSRALVRSIWIGIAIGAVIALLFPPILAGLGVIIRRLAMAWWLWVGIGAYWYWRRTQRSRKP